MSVINILKYEAEEGECKIDKLKDNVWIGKKYSEEIIRLYFHVTKGNLTGLRFIFSGDVKFIKDKYKLLGDEEIELFIGNDIKGIYKSLKVKGATNPYEKDSTEIVLRFNSLPKCSNKSGFVIAFQIHSMGYPKFELLPFILNGEGWKYEANFYTYKIKKEDIERIIPCKRIESWLIPPHYKYFIEVVPDGTVKKFISLDEEDIARYQNEYEIENVGPPGSSAFQWDQEGNYGVSTPPMRSHIILAVKTRSLIPLIVSFFAVTLSFLFYFFN
jgi:hypothetical protein